MVNYGCWLDIPSAQVAEIVGQSGFDFVVIDLEHGVGGVETAQVQMMALTGMDCAQIVRVPEATEGWVKRVLDAGATGVMVPKVESASVAEAIVSWAFYAPKGARGDARSVVRAARWGRDVEGYKSRWNDGGLVAVQIESVEGLANIEAIAKVAGVSQLFFGPADYSADAGVAIDSAETLAAAETIARVAKENDLSCGAVTFPLGTPAKLAELGFTYISVSGDVGALTDGLSRHLATAKGA